MDINFTNDGRRLPGRIDDQLMNDLLLLLCEELDAKLMEDNLRACLSMILFESDKLILDASTQASLWGPFRLMEILRAYGDRRASASVKAK
ncbi:MAG: hypothetical protein IPO60_09775 [Flavobacteriales bacterium]|nr:hypothetical protein [Flavobacteriales bacterium]MBK9598579.1 hypothetical protein [Flavobacteriales bacterium]HQY04136.1 hypothetical protein [Flavobacteriales bacterium]